MFEAFDDAVFPPLPLAVRRLNLAQVQRLRRAGAKCADCGAVMVTAVDLDLDEALCRPCSRHRMIAEIELRAAGMGRPVSRP